MDDTVFARNCTSIGALTIVIWEGIAGWGLEYKYIWNGPSTSMKRLFLFSRYFGISAQVMNCILTGSVLSQLPIRTESCRVWYTFQIIAGRSLLAALEIVLSLRVYVLYNRSYRVALFLAGLILSGIAVTLIYGVGTILNDLIFDSDCRTRGPHNDTLFVSLFIFVTHIILWTLTVQKRNATAHNGWMRQKIVHMVVRDGAWIFFLIFSICASIIPYVFLDHLTTNIVFSCPMALISIFCCRLILNMLSLKPLASTPDPEFTTNVYISIETTRT